MTGLPRARRPSPCPGCATCRRRRRERLWALVILAVFVWYFVAPAVWRAVTW